MKELDWDICSYTKDVLDRTGLIFTPTKIRNPLSSYDIVMIPGGFGTRKLVNDRGFIQWI